MSLKLSICDADSGNDWLQVGHRSLQIEFDELYRLHQLTFQNNPSCCFKGAKYRPKYCCSDQFAMLNYGPFLLSRFTFLNSSLFLFFIILQLLVFVFVVFSFCSFQYLTSSGFYFQAFPFDYSTVVLFLQHSCTFVFATYC